MNIEKLTLNERIVFIDHEDNLNIQITTNKTDYFKRDSIGLAIRVTDKNGDPVQAGLSLSVTDDNLVTTDSAISHSLLSDMLLTSDIKGNVEEPGYYIQRIPNTDSWLHLDNLLLTQGWVSYSWNTVFNPLKPPRYKPETEFLVKGRVTNIFNKPVSNTGIVLLSQKLMLVKDTSTNDSGIFTYNNIIPSDSAVFLLQAKNRKGKSFNVGIEMEEFEPPVFAISAERSVPWYVNIDTLRLSAIETAAQYKEERDKLSGKGQMLAEVIVRAKKIIPDSKNLNGNGEADLILNAADLDKAGKQTLGMLLEKNIRGFGLGGKTGHSCVVFTMMTHLIIDGIFVEQFKPEGTSMQEYYKNFLDYYTAEDIKGIEIMRTGKYQMSYTTRFLGPFEVPWDHVFIEITTYGGKGPFMKKVPGVYLYKPLAFTLPSRFYAPKYTTDTTVNLPDIRSTIHWEPNIITDKKGKATVSFYAADHPGSYTIIVEGSGMNGYLCDYRQKIRIKNP